MIKSLQKVFPILSFLFIFSISANITFALTPLPKYAYLRYLDNQKEVLILQQILNSDPETLVAPDGPGSPGNENWFFGAFTKAALKKFQEKYGLEVTGQIDYKTWAALNNYVENTNNPPVQNTNTQPSTSQNSNQNPYLSGTNNPYIDNSSNTNTNTQTPPQNSSPQVIQTTPAPSSYTTLLDSILARYKSYFSPTPTQTNPYISQPSPYSSPTFSSPSSNPSSNQSANPFLPSNFSSPYSSPATPFSQPAPQNQSPISRLLQTLTGNNQNTDISQTSENSGGKITNPRSDIGQCRATSFAHATFAEGCVADRADQQNGQRAASGQILSRTGVPAIPAVALPRSGNFGDAVEVKDLSTGKCKAFPLLDRGPGAGPLSKGVCIDLTGSAVDILKGRQPCKTVGPLGEGKEGITQVQYAIIPGEKIQPGQTKECTHLTK